MELVDWIMLAPLILMVVFIALGMLWGFFRGFKRSLFRFATLSVALILAFFLAPVFGGIFANITLPFLGDGQTVGEFISYQFNQSSPEAADATADFAELYSVVNGIGPAIMSLLAFFILYVGFWFLTWIIYMIFARKVGPRRAKQKRGKKTNNGTEIFVERDLPQRKWLGLLVGGITGFVMFLFFSMPITGGLGLINTLATDQPNWAREETRANFLNQDYNPLAEVFEAVEDANNAVARTPFGLVSRYTGMQWLGGHMFGYLTTVQTDSGMANINLYRDLIDLNSAFRGFMAISVANEDLENLPAAYWDGLVDSVNKFFDAGVIRLAFGATAGLADFLDDWGVIHEATEDMFEELEGENLNERFADAIIETIRQVTGAEFVRNNIVGGIGAFRHFVTSGLYTAFVDVFDQFGEDADTDELEAASARFNTAIQPTTAGNTTTSPLYVFFRQLFDLPVFRIFETGDEESKTADIVRVPLIAFLDLDEAGGELDFDITFNYNLPRDLTNIFLGAGQAFVGIVELINHENPLRALEELSNPVLEGLASVFHQLTHDSVPINESARSFLVRFLDDEIENTGLDYQNDRTDELIHEAITRLRDMLYEGINIQWFNQLVSLRNTVALVNFISEFDPEESDLSEILDRVFDEEFLETLMADEILGPLVVEQMEELLNDTLADTVGDTFGITLGDPTKNGEDFADTLYALSLISNGMNNIITELDDDEAQEMDGDRLVYLLGDDIDNLETVAEMGVITIELEYELFDEVYEALIRERGQEAATLIMAGMFAQRSI